MAAVGRQRVGIQVSGPWTCFVWPVPGRWAVTRNVLHLPVRPDGLDDFTAVAGRVAAQGSLVHLSRQRRVEGQCLALTLSEEDHDEMLAGRLRPRTYRIRRVW